MSLRAKRSNLNPEWIAAPLHKLGARNDGRVKIFISGTIARDLIMDFPGRFRDHIDPEKIHVLSLSFAVENLKENYGGTAANISYNLCLLKERPEIIGAIGKDGLPIKKYLQKLGVSTRQIKISRYRTSAAYIITDRDDNQITGFHAGAMMERANLPRVKKGDWAIVAAENPRNMVKLAKHYTKQGVNYIFDPGQQITALSHWQLAMGIKGARVLIGNDYEVGVIEKRLSPSPYPSHQGRGNKKKFPLPLRERLGEGGLVMVRTLGPKGSEIITGGRKIKIGIAKPKKVLDPTGAGDAYRAGFLKGLILGYNLKVCGQLGATVASYAVEKYGTQNHKFSSGELQKRLKKNFL